MASQSEKAQVERARQALRAPPAVGGMKFNPGKLNRRMRRAAASTKGVIAAAERTKAVGALADAAKGAK